MTDTKSEPAAKEIWDTLSAVNVNEHTQEKGGLTYLSWAWAWGIMMSYYPDMIVRWFGTGEYPDVTYYPGGSAAVECEVTIRGISRNMWLPVMDYRNKAIANPDSRAISDSKMRCLTKCFALFGLGHYIYAGEDIPGGKGKADELIEQVKTLGKALTEDGYTVDSDLRDWTLRAIKDRDELSLSSIIVALRDIRTTTPPTKDD